MRTFVAEFVSVFVELNLLGTVPNATRGDWRRVRDGRAASDLCRNIRRVSILCSSPRQWHASGLESSRSFVASHRPDAAD